MDARGPVTRASKALAFFRQDSFGPYYLYPHPWRLESAPYYVVEGLDNSDGHGGYGSACRFDREGVPYICTRRGREIYHPLVIARYVLRMFSLSALTGDEGAHEAAEGAVAALARSGAPTGVWRPGSSAGDMSGDVPSSIIQGSVISALVRVGQQKPGVIPNDVLRRAINALVGPAAAGGTVTHSLEGPFLEEFDSLSHVLNGCVYGLWALYDLIDGLANAEVRSIAESVESCLARLAPRFTMANGWSLYALDTYGYAPLASIDYHRLHIRMFRLLSARTGHVAYGDAVERWETALNSRSVKCAVLARKCAQVVWMRDCRRLPLLNNIWD
jgi:hypothetical protein